MADVDLDKLIADLRIARRDLANKACPGAVPRVTPESYDALIEMVEAVRQLEIEHNEQCKRLGLSEVDYAHTSG